MLVYGFPATVRPEADNLRWAEPAVAVRPVGEKGVAVAKSVGERSNFKIFLRTRKIMVMHNNERGECCPRTLVDR